MGNKKANLNDPIDAVMIMFGVVIVLFLVYTVLTNFNTNVVSNNATNYSGLQDFTDTYETRFKNGWDFGFLLMILLFPVFSFIAARSIPSNPMMVILVIFILGFILLGGAIVSNIHGGMMDNTEYSTFVESTTFIKFFMPKMFYYVMAYTMIVLIGLFGKPEGQI